MTSRLDRKYKLRKKVAITLLVIFVTDIVTPTAAYALTSGPASPEFSSFEPVSSTEMVNPFTGDFTYNLPVIEIPGADGGGYAMSLSYHSGANMEEEASWVGYGWTLNPGAINRSRRGVVDDWKGQNVTYYNKARTSHTITAKPGVGFEAFSGDLPINLSAGIRYNNYKGFGYVAGVGVAFAGGFVNLGYNISDGDGAFSLQVNPMTLVNASKRLHRKSIKSGEMPTADQIENANAQVKSMKYIQRHSGVSVLGSNYGIASHATANFPVNTSKFSGQSVTFDAALQVNPNGADAGPTFKLSGTYNRQSAVQIENIPQYGYMYRREGVDAMDEEANTVTLGQNRKGVVLDYHREDAGEFNKRDTYLSVPFGDPDQYLVTGEGLGEGFVCMEKVPGLTDLISKGVLR